jgi:hypothetical protein
MADQEQAEPLGWAIVELMGHRVVAGFVSEVTRFGAALMRVDVPGRETETAISQLYGGAAIYCVTPTTEETVRRKLQQTYELPEMVRLALPAPEASPPEPYPYEVADAPCGDGPGEEELPF